LDETGQGPLHFCRSSKSVKILLRSGALIDHQDTLGRTALHVAATRGQAEVLQALIEAGATLDPRDNRHMTPLHYAVQQKDRRMMEMLLQTSININIQDNMGNTPLLMAVKIGDLAMVTLLVEKGADPFIENKQGSSSFLISLSYDTVMFLSKFLGHSSFQIFSWDNKVQALHWACKQGSPATLRLYLDQIPKTPEIRQQLVGAIHTAAKACRADLAKVLLSDDFQVDAIDIDGSTALLLACQAGRHGEVENYYQRVNLCKALILAGANIAARNNHNQTPVAIAKAHKDFELMTLLLNSARKLPANSSESEITQLTQSTLFFYKDAQYCKEAASFIGDETIEPELVRDAVKREQWDFVMTCIGGHFISKQDLGVDWEGQISGIRIGRLDELRFLCVQRNRDIVRYVFGKIHGCDSTVTHDPNTHLGLRNMEFEWHESKSRLMTIIWEEAMKPFGETLRAIERRPLDFEGQASISRDFVAFCRYAESDDDLPGRVGLGDRKGQSSSQETEQNGPDDALGSLAMNPNASLCPSDDSRQMDLNRHLDLPDISELVKVNWRYFDAARSVLYLHQQVEMSYILMKAWSKEFDKNGLERNDRTVYLWAQETLADIEKHCQQARDSLGLLKTCLQRELDAQPEKEGSSWNFLHHAARALDPHLNELLDDISWALDQLGMMKMEGKRTTKGLTDFCRKHMSRGIVMKAVSFLNGWGGKAWY
jgi:ankyrin repeat protein